MHTADLEAVLVRHIREVFPEVRAILLWGSVLQPDTAWVGGVPGEAMHHAPGDVDVILVLPYDLTDPEHVHAIQVRLTRLASRFTAVCGIELDAAVMSPEQLPTGPISFLVESGLYPAHGMLQYLLKNESKVIYGDASVVDAIPYIALQDALRSMLPSISAIVAKLRTELSISQEAVDTSALCTKHLPALLVLTRIIYSADTGQIGSKMQALDHVCTLYPQYGRLISLLKAIYERRALTGDALKVSGGDVGLYLDLVDEVARRLL
jgi:hypothetical protein